MITKNPTRKAVITDTDFDRLMQLVASPRYRSTDPQRIVDLKQELDGKVLVAPERVPRSTVTMNSRVKVRDMVSDETEVYTIVFPDDADMDQNRLSVLAPLGTALLGRSAGDEVEFHAPAGVRRLRIERIVYQPEAAGDLHL